MEPDDGYNRRRRLSDMFNPRDKYLETSSSDSTLTEEDIDATNEDNPHNDSIMVESVTLPSNHIVEEDTGRSNEVNKSVIVEPVILRRSSRKKTMISPLVIMEEAPIRTVKLTAKSSDKAIQNYYLDKKVKRTNPSLETIYEEPQVINNEEVIMSTRKFKRVINFSAVSVKNCAKVKKRKVKAKNLKNKMKYKKVTLKHLMDKLREIDE